MYFLIEDDDFLEKHITILDTISSDIKKEFDSEPACNKHFFKTQIKSHGVTKKKKKKIPKVDILRWT